MRSLSIYLAISLIGANSAAAFAAQRALSADQVREIYQRAVADPGDDAKLDAYIATLKESPRGSGIYVVEGDLSMSRDAIRAYLALKNNPGDISRRRSKELIVNVVGGRFDYWVAPASRHLTYSFVPESFPSRDMMERTRNHLSAAARDWEKACKECGVRFAELSSADASRGTAATLLVQYLDENSLVAKSFFPSDPGDRRVLYVYPQFFGALDFDRTGVLRHELGHVLGYRHEHIANIPGCEGEDDNWRMITPYTPNSVMHYFCGGAGSLDLALRPNDIEGHRCLYTTGKPCPAK